ncbi:MAG TPA: hypothetical protein H9935_02675 [Candidatus Blautia merdigallinarum]|uniref:Uncharacterized protein n=1 Tax=Candidatus Blautia merdigallinarum TaxID=2838495 RepID=A0A9D2N466_9FIRM|nr:hypothetical protein [Candidatus Blautia merdigallinarum]
MGYETFKEELLDHLRRILGDERKIRFQTVEKNNGIQEEAVVLQEEGKRIAPTIYLREFFESWENESRSMEEISREILWRNAHQEREVDFSLDSFENYEKARGQVYFKLINYEMNKVLLTKIPYIAYLDLAVVFYYRLEKGRFQGATMLIHNCNLEAWKINSRQLLEDAVMNTSRKLPYSFRGMDALIHELSGEDAADMDRGEEIMYVLTNQEKCFGAAALLYPHVLSHISKILRRNFYVLPSSVHECILVPDQGQYSRLELARMVREVNQTQVEEDEILSYQVYYYDRQKETLMM